MKRLLRICIVCMTLALLAGLGCLSVMAEKASPTLTVSAYVSGDEAKTPVAEIFYGTGLTLRATLTGADAPAGEVSFYLDGALLGEAKQAVEEGDEWIVELEINKEKADRISVRRHTIYAVYSGDTQNNVTYSPDFFLDVQQKVLTVEGVVALEKEYDGTTEVKLSKGTLIGVLDGDTVSYNVSSAAFVSSDVSSNVTVNARLALTGADSGNYTLTQPTGLKANIVDNKAPTGDITVNGSSVIGGDTDTDPALFYRNGVTISLTYGDLESGVKSAKYQLVRLGGSPDPENYSTVPEEGNIAVAWHGCCFVYLLVEDHSGNVTVLRSKGLVIFQDATAKDTSKTHTLGTGQTLTFSVNLKFNTVKGLTLDGKALDAGDFSVNTVDNETGEITLAAAFLEGLSAGEHTLKVSYNGAGYEYVSGDEPRETALELEILRGTPTAAELVAALPQSAVYSGEPYAASVRAAEGVTGLGAITLRYRNAAGNVSETAPIHAGRYTLLVQLAEGERYAAASEIELGEFEISRAPVAAPAGATAHGCTTLANNDGRITGIPTGAEYRPVGGEGWSPLTGSVLEGLVPGSYELRMAEDNDHLAGAARTLSVARYEGFAEATPTVRFEAADGSLTGIRAGERYRIDGGEWQALTAETAALLCRPMTVEIYLPGDGVYTLDSAIQRFVLVRPGAPTVKVYGETLFARCDGYMIGVSADMEYRLTGTAQFLPIEGDRVTGLCPGDYELRVRAAGTSLAGESAWLTVTAAPEFVERELGSAPGEGLPGLTVSGAITEDAVLTASPLSREDDTEGALLSRIDQRTTDVLAYLRAELNGRTREPATVSVFLGEEYGTGREVTVYLEENGSVTKQTLLTQDGSVSFLASGSVSILITEPMTTPHGRGSAAWIVLLAVFVGLAIGICVFMEIRTRRAKK